MFIIGNILGSVFWGAVIAIVITALVFLVCQVLDRSRSPLTYIVLAVLLLLAGFQSTMMVGAMYAKGYINDIGDYATMLIDSGEDMAGEIADFNALRSQLEKEFPLASKLLDDIDTSELQAYVDKGNNMANFITDHVRSEVNYYILRRVLWMTGFIVIAFAAILFFNRRHDYTYDINNLDTIY
jgi:predicted PurR-regulated permease PerM